MPYKCHSCLAKFSNDRACIEHYITSHPDDKISIYRSREDDEYIAIHYGLVPADSDINQLDWYLTKMTAHYHSLQELTALPQHQRLGNILLPQ